MRTCFLFCFFIISALSFAVPSASAEWTAQFKSADLTLPSTGADEQSVALIVRLSGLEDEVYPQSIEVHDQGAGLLGRGELSFQAPIKIVEPGIIGQSWLIPTTVSGYKPGDTDTKIVTVRDENSRQMQIELTVSMESKPFTWSIETPSQEFALDNRNNGFDVTISVGSLKAERVKLGRTHAVETTTKRLLQGGWKLCERSQVKAETCGPYEIAANTHLPLVLIPKTETALVGKYATNFSIFSDQSAEPLIFSATIYGSNPGLKRRGLWVLIFGVLVAWLASAFAGRLLAILRLKRSATLGSNRLARLQKRIESVSESQHAVCVNIAARVKFEKDRLEWKTIENEDDLGGLPRLDSGLDTSKTEARLLDVAVRTNLLELVVKYGYEALRLKAAEEKFPGDANAIAALEKAYADLEALAERPPIIEGSALDQDATDAVIAKIVAIVDEFLTSTYKRQAGLYGASQTGTRTIINSVTTLETQVRRIGYALVILNAVITALIGYLILIDANPGFGLARDYILCLIWGFSLPTAAATLQQQTPMSIAQKMNLPI